jgi:hypothetical protein
LAQPQWQLSVFVGVPCITSLPRRVVSHHRTDAAVFIIDLAGILAHAKIFDKGFYF